MKPAYKTKFGEAYNSSIEKFIESENFENLKGKVDLILTSPPYPLVSPKAYGNKVGEDYKNWLSGIMKELKLLLKPKGSLVVEIGNAWVIIVEDHSPKRTRATVVCGRIYSFST